MMHIRMVGPARGSCREGPKRVLVVDDVELVARGTRRMLLLAWPAAEVELAVSVDEALRRARVATLDLALLDLHIGAHSGIALALELRAARADLPVAFMTGEPTSEAARRSVALSPLAVLAKPFSLAELRAAIHRVMDR
jgi:DNA-binding NtrC family response regulator